MTDAPNNDAPNNDAPATEEAATATDDAGIEATGRLAEWDGTNANLRDWTDEQILDGLKQLGIDTDKARFEEAATSAVMQASLEDNWLEEVGPVGQNFATFIWMSVQELWERWRVDAWPQDRMARMFAYLVDADYSTEWADRFHAPTGMQVMDALVVYTAKADDARASVDAMVEELGMPAAAWPAKTLDAMAEWMEVSNFALAGKAAEWLASVLGRGHKMSFLAAALMTARMYDRAKAAALQVPHDVKLKDGFDEMVGYLCLSAGDAMSAHYWLYGGGKRSKVKRSEMTFAAEHARNHVKKWKENGGGEVDEKTRKASLQAASQSCYFAFMAFAGMPEIG